MATAEGAPPNLRPLRVGEILDVGIKVYTRNAKTLFKLVALVVIPIQIIGVLVIISTIPDALAAGSQNPFAGFTDPGSVSPVTDIEPREFLVYMAGVLVTLILGFIGTTIATGACFKAVSEAYLGNRADWKTSLRYSLSHAWSLLWVLLIVLVVTIVGMAIPIGVTLLPAIATQEVAAIFLVFLGLIVAVLFAAAVGIFTSVALPVVLSEDSRGIQALKRSFALVKSRFWPVTAVVVISYLIRTILNSAVGTGVVALTFTDIGQSVFLTQAMSGAAGAIAAIIATPFQAAVIAVLYFDLRVRNEGFDLQLLAQKIGTSDPSTAHAALLPPPVPTGPVYQPGAPAPAVHTSPPANGLAIASLVSGIFICIGSIPAVIMSHMALGRINRSQGAQGGRGLAIGGIVMGYAGIALLALIAFGAIAAQSG